MNEIGIFEFAAPERLWWLCLVPIIIVAYALMTLWTKCKLRRFGNNSNIILRKRLVVGLKKTK